MSKRSQPFARRKKRPCSVSTITRSPITFVMLWSYPLKRNVSCSLYDAASKRVARSRMNSLLVCFMLLVCVRSGRKNLLLRGFLLRTQSSAYSLVECWSVLVVLLSLFGNSFSL